MAFTSHSRRDAATLLTVHGWKFKWFGGNRNARTDGLRLTLLFRPLQFFFGIPSHVFLDVRGTVEQNRPGGSGLKIQNLA